MPTLRDSTVYVNGEYLVGDDARVSVWDHGLMYGDAVFDTCRLYDGKLFAVTQHIDRFFDSAKGILLTPPFTPEELKKIIMEVVKRNKISNAQIRMILTRGTGGPGLDPSSCKEPTIIVSAVEVPPMLGRKPLRLMTSAIRKKSPVSIDSKIKSANYLDSVLAKIQSKISGFDDAVMLDSNGYVAEVTGANIFFIKKGQLGTPFTASVLGGITRSLAIEFARGAGLMVSETLVTVHDLYSADEIFITGTGVDGFVPVGEVDGRVIGTRTPGPITERLQKIYWDATKSGPYVIPVT
ncbi:MAG: branched-chain-amino-acid transaminase [Thaumarchaeota archaeon]|nr:branched-chain-amino-acid transaminase [Nitrososphaerota archaeon]